MSATGRGRERDEHDFYETPAWCVHRLLEAVPQLPGGAWLEPCAGKGAIIRAVNEVRKDPIHWTAVEIDPSHRDDLAKAPCDRLLVADVCGSLAVSQLFLQVFDVAITNPPYRQAQRILEMLFKRAEWIALLLRVGFLEGLQRNALLREHPPDLYVLPNRPSFKFHGTDATTYAWMVWPPEGTRSRVQGRVSVLPLTMQEDRRRM